ncbi:hypothetical protein V494_00659 [Pseudogymnoascus sp. VKM F-4513 (FW-928)]|nr:hypothetical protein V494_00659 [Pseudogymnoascus sp. VKM F-4513 (FW-928)]
MQGGNDVAEGAIGNEDSTSDGCGVLPAEAKHPIDILHEDVNPVIDIVAVHGLGANPDYAWLWLPKNNPPNNPSYPKKPLHWLRDLLPSKLLSSELPCRVMTFNYDSRWFLKAPQQRLSNISDNLLGSLRNNRKEATDRPLIFIGHSFGGNLIEQAIVSSISRSEYKHIAESTVGVIFLGTPHRGSEAAKWGILIASVAGSFVSTEKRILDDLQEQSSTLIDRLHDFSRWLFSESVPVVCYWEQLATDYSARAGPFGFIAKSILNEVVVNETSACIDGHQKISLHTDHFKINKFYGPDDPSFLQVYPEIVRMAENAEEMLRRRRHPTAIPDDQNAQPKRLMKFLRALKVTNAKDVLSDIKRRKGGKVGNTCEWILKRKEFSAWGAAADPQLLFITGSPGIGKTMMSTFLVDELQKKVEKAPGKILAYFFCDDKHQDQKTPTAILRSLIWQILLQKNELFESIKPDYNAQGDKIVENFSTLWRTLEGILRDERAGEVFIHIDAFDECDKSVRNELLICIKELFQSSPTEQAGNFKLCVTSRPEHDILGELSNVGSHLLMNATSVNEDLSMYIDFTVDQLAKRRGYAPTLKEMVQNALKNEAEGTFLWVSLMVADLEKEPKYNVKRKLNNLPKGLNETYSRILNENISEEMRDDAQFLLLTMVAARRPLRQEEIASAFALWKNGSVLSNQDVDEYTDICLSCSSIIYLDARDDNTYTTINFCHQSVKDFLLGDHDRLKSAWYHTSRDHANLALFQVCWKHLSAEDLNHGEPIVRYETRDSRECLANVGSSIVLEHLFQEYVFLRYAYTEWEEHAIASIPIIFDMFTFGSGREPVAAYPNVLRSLVIDVACAPALRDTWLFRAAKEGQEKTVALLHELGANLNMLDYDLRSPLSWAAYSGHEAIVRLILSRDKGSVDSKDRIGLSPLLLAAQNGHDTVASLLLDTAIVEADSKCAISERTPLSYAAEGGHMAVIMVLFKTGKVDPDSRDRGNRSPLSYAAQCGHDTIVIALLKTDKVDPDLRDGFGWSPLSYAAKGGHEDVAMLLLKTSKVDPDGVDSVGRSPLSYAAEGGHKAVVALLLNTGKVGPDSKDERNRSPLSYAAEDGHEAVVMLLLNTGKVDPDSRDRVRRSPLSYAVQSAHEAVAMLLLESSKVDPDSRDRGGRSPLSYAAEADNGHGVTALLLKNGKVDPDSRGDRSGWSPLLYASLYGNDAAVMLLLKTHRVEPNIRDKDGKSPILLAAKFGHVAVAMLLLNEGKAKADVKDEDGRSPLSWAASRGKEAFARLLLSVGEVEADSRDENNQSPLSWAASEGHETVVRLLLGTGKVDPDSRDKNDRSPLWWAVQILKDRRASWDGHRGVARLLLETGKVESVEGVNRLLGMGEVDGGAV